MAQTLSAAECDVVLCDLDGVVWLSHRLIQGSDTAVRKLRDAGIRVVFVTNNSHSTAVDVANRLAAIGIPADGDVITSARGAAALLTGAERVLVCGGPGIVQEVEARGCCVEVAHESSHGVIASDQKPSTRQLRSAAEPYDAVVVGFHREFDFNVMQRAAGAIRDGASFIATNDDPTYPTPEGLIPGGGAIVAAIEKASGVTPIVAGKPHLPLARVVMEEIGAVNPERMVMIGDRVSTDGDFAKTLGCRFGLVLTGVGTEGDIDKAHLWGRTLHDIALQIVDGK